jgi:hypothetical protein
MTGGIFKKDDAALLQANEKPRLKWPAYVCFAFVGLSNLGRIVSDRRPDDGEIIGAYITLALIVAILIFRTRRRIKPHRNRASGVLGETEQRD